jgi:hypothetical protein
MKAVVFLASKTVLFQLNGWRSHRARGVRLFFTHPSHGYARHFLWREPRLLPPKRELVICLFEFPRQIARRYQPDA